MLFENLGNGCCWMVTELVGLIILNSIEEAFSEEAANQQQHKSLWAATRRSLLSYTAITANYSIDKGINKTPPVVQCKI
jgi:hypothetical protein